MTIPPIPKNNSGIQGSVAYWKQLATDPQDAALDRLAGTLETLRVGHNDAQKRLAKIESQLANLPWPLSEGP